MFQANNCLTPEILTSNFRMFCVLMISGNERFGDLLIEGARHVDRTVERRNRYSFLKECIDST
jgi:hypothetical protein